MSHKPFMPPENDLVDAFWEAAQVAPIALRTFGQEQQRIVALEELAEAGAILARSMRSSRSVHPDDVVSEVADALLVLLQMAHLYGCPNVAQALRFKTGRLKQRLEDERKRLPDYEIGGSNPRHETKE